MRPALLDGDALSVINVGLQAFVQSVREHRGRALEVDWQPPGDGDPGLAWALAQLVGDDDDPTCVGSRIDQANARAVERIVAAQPRLVDVALHARDVWPSMERTLLHAGAPLQWDRMCGPMQGAMIGALLYEQWVDSADAASSRRRCRCSSWRTSRTATEPTRT
jgi:hypothetical protein